MRKTTPRPLLRWVIGAAMLFAWLLCSRPSRADQPFMLQLNVGFAGSAKHETDAQDLPLSWTDSEQGLQDHFGLSAFYLVPAGERWRLGGRLAYLTAVGDDTGNHLPVVDLGPWVRVEFMSGDLRPFADLGLGASYGWVRNDNLRLGGFGWHVMLGGGAAYAVNADIMLHAGLYFGYQNFPKVSGEVEFLGRDADFEASGSINRLLLALGVQF